MVLQCLYVKTGNQNTNTSNCLNETVWRKQIDINRTVWKQKKIQQKTSAVVHVLNILQTKKKCSRKKKNSAVFLHADLCKNDKTRKSTCISKTRNNNCLNNCYITDKKKNTACRTE